ncbi:hypothetical protein, partial [Lysinibacillus sp. D4A3_S15]|uniref:hypothetical protein n=1 Tax=Lysinibacillus sp. D4A3_S15 TaxID=2941227 RepID=UPI0020C0AEBA
VLNGANPAALRILTVKASPSTVDVLGQKITAESQDIADKIKATVKKVVKVADKDNQIKITFNEAVTAVGAESDFVVVDNLDEDNK